MQINILEAKNRLSELIKCAQAGEDVIIANRGRPVARLIAEGSTDTEEQGRADRILGWLAQHPLPPYARRSAEEIDAAIEEERQAWD
jgi:prevent-host-death family protein